MRRDRRCCPATDSEPLQLIPSFVQTLLRLTEPLRKSFDLSCGRDRSDKVVDLSLLSDDLPFQRLALFRGLVGNPRGFETLRNHAVEIDELFDTIENRLKDPAPSVVDGEVESVPALVVERAPTCRLSIRSATSAKVRSTADRAMGMLDRPDRSLLGDTLAVAGMPAPYR